MSSHSLWLDGDLLPPPCPGQTKVQGSGISGPAEGHLWASQSPFTARQLHFCSLSPSLCCLVGHPGLTSSSLLNSKLSGFEGSTFIRALWLCWLLDVSVSQKVTGRCSRSGRIRKCHRKITWLYYRLLFYLFYRGHCGSSLRWDSIIKSLYNFSCIIIRIQYKFHQWSEKSF